VAGLIQWQEHFRVVSSSKRSVCTKVKHNSFQVPRLSISQRFFLYLVLSITPIMEVPTDSESTLWRHSLGAFPARELNTRISTPNPLLRKLCISSSNLHETCDSHHVMWDCEAVSWFRAKCLYPKCTRCLAANTNSGELEATRSCSGIKIIAPVSLRRLNAT
jgi:hypothetical protein